MAQLNVKTSVIDYLKSVGKPSDYASRSKLAEQYGIADYAGSYAQNIQLLGKMTTTNKEVIASDMGEGSTPPIINYGDSKPESANNAVSNSYSNAKAVTTSTDILLKRLDDLEAERDAARTEKQGWLEKMTAKPEQSYEEKRAALIKETGITEESELVKQQNIKVATLQGDLDKIELQQREEIDRAYDQPTAMPNIRAEANEINRAYDRKKAYKAVEISSQVAILQAYQGNLNMSYDTLDTAIKGWMWDYEENRKRWEIMYDYHSDYLDDLDTDSRKIYDMAYDSAVRDEETAREDADYMRNLWIDAGNKGVYLNFNDMLNMTKDEATDMYAKAVSATGGEAGWATGTPTSYKEWQLAGSPGEYEDWVNKSSVSLPTIYGLTKKQTEDVLFSPSVPSWFSNQMTNLYQSSNATRDQGEWDKYKKEVVEKNKEIRQELGVGSAIDSLWGGI